MPDSTPIPAGALTEPTSARQRPTLEQQRAHLEEGSCGCHDSWDQCPCAEGGHPADGSCGCCPLGTGLCGPLPQQSTEGSARLLSPPRPTGVPDELVSAALDRLCDLGGDDHGHTDCWIIGGLLTALGVPVPPYQPTPPEPEPLPMRGMVVCRFCGSKRCPCADDPSAPCEANMSNAVPVSEVRIGPLGQRDYLVMPTIVHVMRYRGRNDDGRETWRLACGSHLSDDGWDRAGGWTPSLDEVKTLNLATCRRCFPVARWDAEDAAPEPETLADIVASLRRNGSRAGIASATVPGAVFDAWADRIEAATRPDPDTITVNRDDVVAMLDDAAAWMDYIAPDAEMSDSVRRLRAAAGLPQEPTECDER